MLFSSYIICVTMFWATCPKVKRPKDIHEHDLGMQVQSTRRVGGLKTPFCLHIWFPRHSLQQTSHNFDTIINFTTMTALITVVMTTVILTYSDYNN